jgi:hypothetical protein
MGCETDILRMAVAALGGFPSVSGGFSREAEIALG